MAIIWGIWTNSCGLWKY